MLIFKQYRIKKVSYIVLILVAIMFLSSCAPKEVLYIPGEYTNESEGYYSTLIVKVTVDEYQIISIEILSHEEPEILAEVVFDKLPSRIIKNNGTQIDVISGATYTSRALLESVEKALVEARGK